MDGRRPRLTRDPHKPRTTEAITGVHAVTEALAAREPVERVFVGRGREKDAVVRSIIEAAAAAAVPVEFQPSQAFARFGAGNHQQVAAIVKPFAYTMWGSVREAVRADTAALVVVLDHVEDPHNLGAVLRNADGAGATAVVIPDRRSAAVTPVARRAAAGAASHVRVASVPNLARILEDLKADGCWVYGLSTDARAVSYTKVDYRGRCALVIGAEGKGLSRLLSDRCDRLARIPLLGKVGSLNAASAAAIALFEAVRQRAQDENGASAP